MKRSRLEIAVVVTACGLVAGACGGGVAVTTTNAPTTPTPALVVPVVDEAFLAEQVDNVSIPESGGAFMVAVLADGEVVYSATGTDPGGNPPTPDSAFRIASITKVFTALATLSLVDEGLVDLDAPAVDYVARVPVPEGVAVRDLLQHTSGIPEFFNDPSLAPWLADPGRVWTPEETVALIDEQGPDFRPGSEWHWGYSNTNYIVLGVLIEEVTGRALAEVLRARIIEPLGMDSTYLAGFEDGPGVFGAYASPSPDEPAEPISFDYTSLVTSTSAAGGVVSTARDLHTLFTALFEGRVVSADSLPEMIGNPREIGRTVMGNESGYGLGIQVWTVFGGRSVEGLVGHGGEIVGYSTLVAHAPETGITAFWVATNNWIDSSPAYEAVVERMSDTQ
jgi:D-alanyl-D-alanine carboxypeptidase